MSLKKSNTLIIALSVLLLLIASTSLLFPGITDNIITGLASFSVSVSVTSNITDIQEPEEGAGSQATFFPPKKKFRVEPNYINITAIIPRVFEEYIIIHNFFGAEEEFIINFTTKFIYDITSSITIAKNDLAKIPIYIDTSNLELGKYTDYVYVRTNGFEEKVTIDLELVEVEEEIEEEKLPEEEQPRPIPIVEEEGIMKKKPNMLVIILAVIGLFIITFLVLLHLEESKPKH